MAEPTWIQHAPIGGLRPEAIYSDSSNDLWVLGGYSRQMRSWCFHQGAWSETRPPVAPPRRFASGIAYDRQRKVVVLFGGADTSGPAVGDLWEFDGVTWTQRTFGGSWPVARTSPAFAYDPVRQRCVLFSGWAWPTPVSDTWEYDGIGWTQVTPSIAPSSRHSAGFTFAANLGKLVLAGGGDSGSALLTFETWTYDGTWTRLQPAVSPPTRQQPLLVHDPLRSRTVLFGGSLTQSIPPPAFTDTWEFDGATWQQVPTTNVPFGIYSGVATWSPAFAAVAHFGGDPGWVIQPSAALTTYDGSDWVQQTAQPLFYRNLPRLAFDSARNRLVLHGGYDPLSNQRRDTFEWGNGTWQQTATNTGPTTAMVYDAVRQRIVAVEAGITWEYDANGWTPRALSPAPAASGPIWFDRFAGVVRTAVGQSLWTFDGATWTVSPTNSPAPSCYFCAAAFHTTDGTVSASGSNTAAYPPRPWRWNGVTWSPASLAYGASWSEVPLAFDAVRGVAMAVTLGNSDEHFSDGGPWAARGPQPLTELPFNLTADVLTGRVFAVARDGTVWEQSWPGAPSFAGYGRGCAGSAGTPRLQAFGPTTPLLGQGLPFELSQLPASPGLTVLAFGDSIATAGGAPLPLPLTAIGLPGCSAWIAPLATLATVHGGFQQTFNLNLPAAPALAGALLGFQALVFDAAAANGIGAVSNALLAVAW